MKTVTLFFDYDHPIKNGCVAYLASNTYRVEEEIANIIAERGLGEVVSDDLLEDDGDLLNESPEIVEKLKRTTMRKRWKQ